MRIRLDSLGCGRFRRRLAIAPIESIYATSGIDQLLLTRKERMACRTDFNVQIALLRRTRLKSLAARASNSNFAIFRMNSRFHFVITYYSELLLPLSNT